MSYTGDVGEYFTTMWSEICDIHREDIDVCTAVQRAIRSGVTSTGRLSHLERQLWEFYRYLGRELGIINATSTLASAG